MPLRELHKYEFACDGTVSGNGVKCSKRAHIEGFNPIDAQGRLPVGLRGWRWAYSAAWGWLCPYYVHIDDPRAKGKSDGIS